MGTTIRICLTLNDLDNRLEVWREIKQISESTLNTNNIAILPTETSYMLAGNALNSDSVSRIYKLKQRPGIMPLSCAFASVNDAKKWVEWSDLAEILTNAFLPGPLTLILPHKRNIRGVTHSDKLGIRIPGLKALREILQSVDYPVTATSANRHAFPEPYTSQDCVDGADFIWDAGTLDKNPPSTILEISGKHYRILREGAIPEKRIRKLISAT
ncbi:threonylcarbamoyl-AMP synthase [bacterium]|nr:threonylcarbamoyl-AMP synthase [candidate division CSSED10-310 bacterium]